MKPLFALFNLKGRRADDRTSFLLYYANHSLYSVRLAFVLAFILYGAFGILDIYMAPDSMYQIWIIRFVFVMPIMVIAYGLSFSKGFVYYAQSVAFITSLVVGFGVLAIILCTETHELGSRHYYSGLILTIIASHTLWRLKAELALISTILLILAYNITAIYLQSFSATSDFTIIINNDFFLISASILGIWNTYTTEKMVYVDFTNARLIHREKEELVHSRKKLMEVSAVKSKLLSIISHDLRGPLASIKGILALHSSGLLSDVELRTNSKHLRESVESTTDLLDNLLSWSLIQQDDQGTEKVMFPLCPLVSKIFHLLNQQAIQKDIQLLSEVNDVTVIGDPSAINLVLRNLISNALKYTQNGTIRVTAKLTDETLEISVADTGTGIPNDVAAELFNWEKRQSYVRPGTKSEKGSGLGLMLCKEFVEKQGGHIFFTTQEGRGTTFYFTIPNQISAANTPHKENQLEASGV